MSIIRSVLTTRFGGLSLATVISTCLMAAATPIPEQIIPMTGPDISYSTENLVPIIVHSFTFQQGDWQRVAAHLEITSNVTSDVYTDATTVCAGPHGFSSVPAAIGTNHTGKNTPPGVNYPSTGHLVLSPDLAFQVPETGVYTCQLGVTNGDNQILTAIARHDDGSPATWFLVSASADKSGAWLQYNCNDKTIPCIYLGGASNPLQTYMFDNVRSPAQLWEAPGDAAFVDANATIEFTTCYNKTLSCLPANWGGDGGSVVSSHLEMIQLDSNLVGECRITKSVDITSTIGNDAHYDPIYQTLLDVPVDPRCGSTTFKLRILATHVSGNPVHINESPSFANTHADIITGYTGTAWPVPNLIGLAEDKAGTYLTDFGYAVGNVSHTTSRAPAGSVISQNPSAGIIELTGSGVNFTVSAGGAYVPNVADDSQSSAIGAIKALGLVPSVSFQKACINPGDVLGQGPPAGTLVALGSTVSITVDSGTVKGCVLK